ncbi:MAG: KH domain-containing protein [Candidatus Micrarchaeota archaeon]
MKKIVVPGELLTEERKRMGEHVYASQGKIFSDTLGIFQDEGSVASVVALKGRYIPMRDDLVIGIVAMDVHAGYLVDINSFYYSFVSKKEIRDSLKSGSIVSGKIMEVSETHETSLGFVRVFYGGEIVLVSPVKVPRMIGKNGSMLDVLKRGTGANIMIGRNGLVWAKGGNIDLLKIALKKIDDEAHKEHLTQMMAEFLKIDSTPAMAPLPSSRPANNRPVQNEAGPVFEIPNNNGLQSESNEQWKE